MIDLGKPNAKYIGKVEVLKVGRIKVVVVKSQKNLKQRGRK